MFPLIIVALAGLIGFLGWVYLSFSQTTKSDSCSGEL
jgi:hypothetical protein